jgi:uncharacterized protein (DUF1697 family)
LTRAIEGKARGWLVIGENGVMATHVALLRGINVGGKNKVAMADLRALVGELGHTDVSTYIQSGNVLFTVADADADGVALGEAMSEAITAKLGVKSPVVVVSREELAGILAANPYPDEPDPRQVHAVVLSEPPWPELLTRLDTARAKAAQAGSGDEVLAVGRTLYLHTPEGFGRSVLAELLMRYVTDRTTGATGTARNWATMTKLFDLCGS